MIWGNLLQRGVIWNAGSVPLKKSSILAGQKGGRGGKVGGKEKKERRTVEGFNNRYIMGPRSSGLGVGEEIEQETERFSGRTE